MLPAMSDQTCFLNILSHKEYPAAFRTIKAAQQGQQGRLSAARRAYNGIQLACLQFC